MPFTRTTLGQSGAARNTKEPREWIYSTADASTDVQVAGYFDDAKDLLGVNDKITVVAAGVRGEVIVAENDGTTVDTTDFVASSVADAD